MKKLTIWIAIIPIMTGLSSCSKDDDYNYVQEDDDYNYVQEFGDKNNKENFIGTWHILHYSLSTYSFTFDKGFLYLSQESYDGDGYTFKKLK